MMLRIVLLTTILPLSSTELNYEYSPLFELLQNALVNDTSNLVKLQALLYPPDTDQESSVYVGVRFYPCDFKVRSISNSGGKNQSMTFDSCTKHGCGDQDYCYANTSLRFQLMRDGTSNSHFKLYYYVREFWNMLVLIESASFELFNYVTRSKVGVVSYNGGKVVNLSLIIDHFEKMPSEKSIADTLYLILSWVCCSSYRQILLLDLCSYRVQRTQKNQRPLLGCHACTK